MKKSVIIIVFLCGVVGGCSSTPSNDPKNTFTVSTPVFSLTEGTYTSYQRVTISCDTSGAVVKYTTDGSTPSRSYGIQSYGTPITVKNTQTIRAVAYKEQYNDSSLVEKTYIIAATLANPLFSVSGGSYPYTQTIRITCPTSGVTIKYTLDGSYPSASNGSTYVAGEDITIATTKTLRAVAIKDGFPSSSMSVATYTITGVVAAPTFTPDEGNYPYTFTVTLASLTADAVIKYTLDGTTPSRSNGTKYELPITVSSSMTIKACAYIPVWNTASDSAVINKQYTISNTVNAPTFSLEGGCYPTAQTITLSCLTSGATIKYCFDSDDPAVSGTVYTAPITVSSTHTIKAYAYKSGYADSATTQATYTITGIVADPTFSSSAGSYTDPIDVTISCTTADAEIKYTLDGTDPSSASSTSSILYAGSIHVSSGQSTRIRAYAFRTGWQSSAVIEGTFAVTGALPAIVMTPSEGSYDNPMWVSIALADNFSNNDLVIKYTDDGTEPSRSNGITYTGPFVVGKKKPHQIKAYAYIADWQVSSDRAAQSTYDIARRIMIVGSWYVAGSKTACLWNNGQLVNLLSIVQGGIPSAKNAVADHISGDGTTAYISGYYVDSSSNTHACYWKVVANNDVTVTMLGEPTAYSSYAGKYNSYRRCSIYDWLFYTKFYRDRAYGCFAECCDNVH